MNFNLESETESLEFGIAPCSEVEARALRRTTLLLDSVGQTKTPPLTTCTVGYKQVGDIMRYVLNF